MKLTADHVVSLQINTPDLAADTGVSSKIYLLEQPIFPPRFPQCVLLWRLET